MPDPMTGPASTADRLIEINLDETGLAPPTPEIEQERRVAIYDLIEENRFALPTREERAAPPGPYRLDLAIRDRRLVFRVMTEGAETAGEFHLSVVQDLFGADEGEIR